MVESEVTILFAPDLSLVALAVLEQVADADPGDDRVFEDEGLGILLTHSFEF